MTDHNTDQARELRRARLTIVRPVAAPTRIVRSDFLREYKERHVMRRAMMPDVEESDRILFCPACVETMEGDDEFVEAHKLHVGYEEDPLRNFPALVNIKCHGCGWSEIIPIEKPAPLTDEQQSAIREDKMATLRNGQLAGMNIHRQAGKSALLAAAYGMGAQGLQNVAAQQQAKAQVQAANMISSPPLLRYGQSIADSIWGLYDETDRQRKEADAAIRSNEARKHMEQMMTEASKAMAQRIDKEVMDALISKKEFSDRIRIGTPRKYAPAPPASPPLSPAVAPPSKLDEHDRAEMRRMLEEAVKKADNDPKKIRPLFEQVKDFFR